MARLALSVGRTGSVDMAETGSVAEPRKRKKKKKEWQPGKYSERMFQIWSRNKENMCADWKASFHAFQSWAERNGYTEKLYLRKNDAAPFSPDNALWAERPTRSYIDIDGRRLDIEGWAALTGYSKSTLYTVHRRGKEAFCAFVRRAYRKEDRIKLFSRSNETLFTADGVTLTLWNWSDILGVSEATLGRFFKQYGQEATEARINLILAKKSRIAKERPDPKHLEIDDVNHTLLEWATICHVPYASLYSFGRRYGVLALKAKIRMEIECLKTIDRRRKRMSYQDIMLSCIGKISSARTMRKIKALSEGDRMMFSSKEVMALLGAFGRIKIGAAAATMVMACKDDKGRPTKDVSKLTLYYSAGENRLAVHLDEPPQLEIWAELLGDEVVLVGVS